MKRVQARNLQNQGIDVAYDKDPRKCPICHHSIMPLNVEASAIVIDTTLELPALEKIYKCPRTECGNFFLVLYKEKSNKNYEMHKLTPKSPLKADIEEEIRVLSLNFEKIFNQSLEAEALGLDEVCGVALRKAFEFLIKDYCISKNQDNEEDIKNMFLGKCIKDYIDDVKIKKCAERAAWLGNDETHYVRKWDEHDISDLKLLIRLSMNWILNDILTEKYLQNMQ